MHIVLEGVSKKQSKGSISEKVFWDNGTGGTNGTIRNVEGRYE